MIEVKGLEKSFGGVPVLRGVDLAIADGEFFCLLGPSGCGKTTLLRIVAGLEKQDAGSVAIGGLDVGMAPPHKRGCAMVFQNYALWPHLTVEENISYGLEVQGKPRAVIRALLDAYLPDFRLEGLGARYPHQLSGGQQQRVALARAMAVRPRALLMDEPLSNLDAALRKSLRRELLEFHRSAGGTVLYVTHDQEEALALSDRLAVMMDGRILEVGTPSELYARPRRPETAAFLGEMNILRGGRIPPGLLQDADRTALAGGGAPVPGSSRPEPILCIRPENVRIHGPRESASGRGGSDLRTDSREGFLEGTLSFREFMGTHVVLGVETAAGRILARATPGESAVLPEGGSLLLEFPREHRLWY